MKNRWKQRGFALVVALALAIPALGVAEAPVDAEQYEATVYAEAVDLAEPLDELDLYDAPTDAATVAEESAPESEDAAGDEATSDAVTAPEDSPEDVSEPEEAIPAGAEGISEASSVAESEPASDGEPAPEASQAPEATPLPQPAEDSEGDAAPVVVEAEAAGSAKIVAEAAPALAFPSAKLTLGKGEWIPLAASLSGSADPVEISYASSTPSVVKVESPGVVHARKKGSAKITATASNGLKATCTIKVVKAPARVRLSSKKLTFGLGETRKLKAKLPKGSASTITWSSANPAVVTVDAAGNLSGVGPGVAKVTARTFNGKKATCTVTVLNGRTPTALTFPSKTITLGLKEKFQLAPQLGAGEAALFTFSSSKKKVASVSKGGLVTAKKKGTAKITVKTHNGLKYKLTVKVVKAPAKVTLSKTKLSLLAGQSATLKATLPSNTSSAIVWSSSDANVASVDGAGNVQALNAGTAKITATTFNGKSAACTVTVTVPTPPQIPPNLTNAQMADNLRNSSLITSKKTVIANVAEMLMNAGYEPSFAAGFCANIYSEGNYGFFESSKYIANYQSRPRYFCFLDGGDYYSTVNGVKTVTTVYLSREEYDAYTGPAEKRLRFGEEKYYWNNWSGVYVWNHDLNELEKFVDLLTDAKLQDGTPDGVNDGKGWHGKFGLGCTQWTGGRTRKLIKLYRKYAGAGSATITKAQAMAAEHEMILYDLQGDYKSVYTSWRSANKDAPYCAEAARSAGSIVCLKYEIPANKEQSAVTRGDRAARFYQIMVGEL